jgi:hypothetical protein
LPTKMRDKHQKSSDLKPVRGTVAKATKFPMVRCEEKENGQEAPQQTSRKIRRRRGGGEGARSGDRGRALSQENRRPWLVRKGFPLAREAIPLVLKIHTKRGAVPGSHPPSGGGQVKGGTRSHGNGLPSRPPMSDHKYTHHTRVLRTVVKLTQAAGQLSPRTSLRQTTCPPNSLSIRGSRGGPRATRGCLAARWPRAQSSWGSAGGQHQRCHCKRHQVRTTCPPTSRPG